MILTASYGVLMNVEIEGIVWSIMLTNSQSTSSFLLSRLHVSIWFSSFAFSTTKIAKLNLHERDFTAREAGHATVCP